MIKYVIIGALSGGFIVVLMTIIMVAIVWRWYKEELSDKFARAEEIRDIVSDMEDPVIVVIANDGCLSWSEGLYSDYESASKKMAEMLEEDPGLNVWLVPVEDKR